ncbi:DUF4041 domain-containing protein [Luteimonas sp. TWI662]|uniref:DUF4041 domain-containing protein n=1 Tax=Luteimonas sp. TWI662 TaxID=3136789 RepID=UPI003208A797
MGWMMFLLALIALAVLMLMRRRESAQAAQSAREVDARYRSAEAAWRLANEALMAENSSLQIFRDVRDASVEASRLRSEASAALAAAEQEAGNIRDKALADAQSVRDEASRESEELRRVARQGNAEARQKAEALIKDANDRAARLIIDAEVRADEIAGDAYRALKDVQKIEQAAIAMRNVIEGYGDRYLRPTYSLLDELADDLSFDEAGRELKKARANTRSMIESDRAAVCEYVERNRRETAVRFVLDAFNGKVDTILSRVKSDNAGTLEQQIHDAFALVNHNGNAFRAARITPEFRDSRLSELKWAAAATALKERERDEQRRIREQIREEERARREIERALREAAKEEDALQKAVARAEAQVAKASEAQRVQLEKQLAELQLKLAEAEVRNRRALSMAQQTKAGHVYVISNVGSFGEHFFKIGMTRRLEPWDRVRELSDASVPFPFDVHAMIWTDDAPALENVLHKSFVTAQVNKVNPRKEFFRVSIGELRNVVESTGIKAMWTLAAEAAQYRETRAIEEDLEQRNADAQRWLQLQMEVPPEELVADEA